MFTKAIVRQPSPEIEKGLSSVNLGIPIYRKAVEQHLKYIDTLESCGLKVEILKAKSGFPDSTFIEDVALCTSSFAVINSLCPKSRRGEINGIRQVLDKYFNNIEEILLPGTLEGGDVMMVDKQFYIGISQRTNNEGADQLIDILKKYNMKGSKIPLRRMLHLKSGLSYLENNNLLIAGEFKTRNEFTWFNRINVDNDESYAANSLWLNGKVLVPDGYPKTHKKIKEAGYEIIVLDSSEFKKIDGGLSCLSLRF